jgi:hypothetical protein
MSFSSYRFLFLCLTENLEPLEDLNAALVAGFLNEDKHGIGLRMKFLQSPCLHLVLHEVSERHVVLLSKRAKPKLSTTSAWACSEGSRCLL